MIENYKRESTLFRKSFQCLYGSYKTSISNHPILCTDFKVLFLKTASVSYITRLRISKSPRTKKNSFVSEIEAFEELKYKII